jgi:sarcosine oxidase subunit beta
MITRSDYDAIVIGAGVIGAAVGLELARKGWRTLNVDKLPEDGYGSTSNSCAIIRTYYSTIEGCALAYEGYHYWRDWPQYIGVEDEAGLVKFIECGTLVMKSEHNNYLEDYKKKSDELGISYEELDIEQVRQRMPPWNVNKFYPPKRPDDAGFGEATGGPLTGAVFWPQGGYISDPQLSVHNIQRSAESHGAEFLFNAEIIEIPTVNGRVAGVRLSDGREIRANVVVNVAGPHSSVINEMAGVADAMKITTRALRHEVPHIPSAPGFDYETQGLVTSDSDIATYTRPASGGQILIGSEDPPCDDREWVDPDNFDQTMSEQGRIQAMRYAQRFEGLGIPNKVGGVVDLYDVTEDWIPIYDSSDLPGFYLAIGTSGNQYKNAPVAGKLMAALIEACENGHDHDATPYQFHLDYIDRSIDLGFCSRNREINQDSSFSVLG